MTVAPAHSSAERRGLLYAVLAVTAFSTSPVLVLFAAPYLNAYEITTWRLAVAGIAVLGASLLVKGWPRVRPGDWGMFILFGLITGLHFLLFIAALTLTSIAHALALVYTAPIFVAIFSALFLHEPLPLQKWVGIAVTVLGVAILAGFEPEMTTRMLLGDLLALGSAVMFGLYSIAGRSQRERYPLLHYASLVYCLGALWLLPVALFNLTSGGYHWVPVLAIIGAGVIPLGIGHTFYNAAVRRTQATYVNIIATQEVTGGVLLGVLILGQMPTLHSLIGAAITLLGVGMVLWNGSQRAQQPTAVVGKSR